MTKIKNPAYDVYMRKLVSVLASTTYFLFFVNPVFAAAGDITTVNTCPEGSGQFDVLCKIGSQSLGSIVGRVITIILIIAIVIAVFFLIFGGIKWVLSGGDKSKVESARNHIVAAIVGLIIALLAFFILSFILRLFGISATNFTVPNIIP